MNSRRCISLLLLCGTIVFGSCMKEDEFDPYVQLTKDVAAIDQYLTSNNITAIKDKTGVRMVITQGGTGMTGSVYANSTVEVGYTGKLFSNGSIFEQNTTTGPLNGYISGWRIALTTLPVGSKATVYIPSGYAYGNTASGTIPKNSILVFDLDFRKIIYTNAENSRFTADTTAIRQYLQSKQDAVAQKDPSGVWYAITQQGVGESMPTLYNKLKLKYTFKALPNDSTSLGTFERQPTDDFDSRVVDHIPGMQVALQKMTEGSKSTVYIPSRLAFAGATIRGDQNQELIKPNTNLMVEIELLDIVE